MYSCTIDILLPVLRNHSISSVANVSSIKSINITVSWKLEKGRFATVIKISLCLVYIRIKRIIHLIHIYLVNTNKDEPTFIMHI